MALNDITRPMVIFALEEFDRLGQEAFFNQYRGAPSTYWYVLFKDKLYDQKAILRAAHERGGLGQLPPGPKTFKALQGRRHLESLGFELHYNEERGAR